MFNGGGSGRHRDDGIKAKNFGQSIKRMLSEMKGFYLAIAIAIIFSLGGSILSVIAPEKLAQITDEISAGIMIDRSKITQIAEEIAANPTSDSVIDGQLISVDDKVLFLLWLKKS